MEFAAPLIVAVEGLPGCGKNYICNKLNMMLQQMLSVDGAKICKVIYKDLDDFSQNRTETVFNTQMRNIRGEINKFIEDSTRIEENRYRQVVILLCGVSFLQNTRGKPVSMLPTNVNTLRLWLDIVPRDKEGVAENVARIIEPFKSMQEQLSDEVFVELIESSRRATLREFRPHELENDWKADPENHDFAGLPIPSEPLSDQEFDRQLKLPLMDFIQDTYFKPYLRAMLQALINDQYGSNRANAVQVNGFQPVFVNQTGHNPVHAVYRLICEQIQGSCFDDGTNCLSMIAAPYNTKHPSQYVTESPSIGYFQGVQRSNQDQRMDRIECLIQIGVRGVERGGELRDQWLVSHEPTHLLCDLSVGIYFDGAVQLWNLYPNDASRWVEMLLKQTWNTRIRAACSAIFVEALRQTSVIELAEQLGDVLSSVDVDKSSHIVQIDTRLGKLELDASVNHEGEAPYLTDNVGDVSKSALPTFIPVFMDKVDDLARDTPDFRFVSSCERGHTVELVSELYAAEFLGEMINSEENIKSSEESLMRLMDALDVRT